MKRWFLWIGLVVFVAGCQEKKIEEDRSVEAEESTEVVEHFGWSTDFEKAQARAKEEGKYMLVDFSGSDWCGWCVKLDKEVFSMNAFKNYAKENLVLVLADFPRDKSKQSAELQKQNKALAEKFGIQGFPTVYILDPNGKPIDKTGYQAGGPEAYVEYIKKAIAAAK